MLDKGTAPCTDRGGNLIVPFPAFNFALWPLPCGKNTSLAAAKVRHGWAGIRTTHSSPGTFVGFVNNRQWNLHNSFHGEKLHITEPTYYIDHGTTGTSVRMTSKQFSVDFLVQRYIHEDIYVKIFPEICAI